MRHNRSVPLDPTAWYPDIAAQGSLAAALQAVADEAGLTVPFVTSEGDPFGRAVVATPVPQRTEFAINSWAGERRWSVRGGESCQGLALVEGDTSDLEHIARAAQAWHDGADLNAIRDAAPFVRRTGRFEVADHDPAQLAESEWQFLRTEARVADWPEFRALVEAAYAEPALRRLYPFTSHWTLRFATTTRPNLTAVPLCLDAYSNQPYVVRALLLGEILAEAPTAAEVVSAALRHLPPGLGPVTFGAL